MKPLALLLALAALAVVAEHAVAQGSPRVVLRAAPTKLGPVQNARLFGQVSNGRKGEQVDLRVIDCGQRSSRSMGLITTEEAGKFVQDLSPGINATVYVVWKGVRSAPVRLKQQARMLLDRRAANRFEIGIGSRGHMWRKRVLVQRRSGSRWTTLKRVLLTDSVAPAGSSYTWTSAEFTARVPQGTVIRAFLPFSESGPCYRPGASNTLRT